jgi:hypothetical protein
MFAVASISADFGGAVGALAGMIAVAGFLAHAGPVLKGGSESEVRRATVKGGLFGFAGGLVVVVLSAFLDRIGL